MHVDDDPLEVLLEDVQATLRASNEQLANLQGVAAAIVHNSKTSQALAATADKLQVAVKDNQMAASNLERLVNTFTDAIQEAQEKPRNEGGTGVLIALALILGAALGGGATYQMYGRGPSPPPKQLAIPDEPGHVPQQIVVPAGTQFLFGPDEKAPVAFTSDREYQIQTTGGPYARFVRVTSTDGGAVYWVRMKAVTFLSH